MKSGPGHRLGRAVAGHELLVRHPAGRHDLGLQQRQHDVPAAEHQRADAVEAVEDGERLARAAAAAASGSPIRRPKKQRQGDDRRPAADRHPHGAAGAAVLGDRQQPPADQPGHGDRQHLPERRSGRPARRSAARIAIVARSRSGAERARHPPDGLRHDRHGHDLEPVRASRRRRCRSPARPSPNSVSAMAEGSVKPIQAISPPSSPARMIPSADPDLAAGRPRQELAERDQVGVGRLVDPLAAVDVLLAEVAEVRDRPAERGQPEPRGDAPAPPAATRPCASPLLLAWARRLILVSLRAALGGGSRRHPFTPRSVCSPDSRIRRCRPTIPAIGVFGMHMGRCVAMRASGGMQDILACLAYAADREQQTLIVSP